MPDKVNPQILDAVTVTSTLVLGDALAESYGVALEASAHSLALIMHNAGTAQFAATQIESAAVASSCAKILAA